MYLVSEADAENSLPHGMEGLKKQAETEDPELVAVGVVRAAADHEAVVFAKLAGVGKLAVDDPEDVPALAFVSKSLHEDVEVAAVDFSHVIRVLRRLQQSVFPDARSIHLGGK